MAFNYENSILIKYKDLEKAPSLQEVVLAFHRQYGSDFSSQIRHINSGGKLKHIISFKDSAINQKLFGQKLKLNEKDFFISDPNSTDIIKTFRVLNLPNSYPRWKIANNLKKYGEILDIKEEGF